MGQRHGAQREAAGVVDEQLGAVRTYRDPWVEAGFGPDGSGDLGVGRGVDHREGVVAVGHVGHAAVGAEHDPGGRRSDRDRCKRGAGGPVENRHGPAAGVGDIQALTVGADRDLLRRCTYCCAADDGVGGGVDRRHGARALVDDIDPVAADRDAEGLAATATVVMVANVVAFNTFTLFDVPLVT